LTERKDRNIIMEIIAGILSITREMMEKEGTLIFIFSFLW